MRQSQQYTPSTDARLTDAREVSVSSGMDEDIVITTIDRGSQNHASAPKDDWRTIKLLQLIEADPSASPRALAIRCQVSYQHLQRLFKRATGLGLKEMTASKRLERAAQLLTKTDMGIKEIASSVGYEHSSSFTRAFVKRFGCGPHHYRMDNALSKVLAPSDKQ
jgi:transcriptional regulator GlxA family with amidase domain